ncbi:DUF898 family protein [Rickettsiales endosymbiont of Stachyamoeba lipophora]|uniref:DUF898 family protein n=1 Tax=Rickettsiales endosymbiont of Stachyamoeba lipophora TaxID=2486578 RepID=UPI0013DDA791|nr:DUF898 family protein [Rickettsiales endosymbiont of Stachyamoeba lipophora]
MLFFNYKSSLAAIYKLYVLNCLLMIITCGIYYPWAVNRVRKYFLECLSIQNLNLQYSGKGSDIFKGALVVCLVYVLPIAAIAYYSFISRSLEGLQGSLRSVRDYVDLFMWFFLSGFIYYTSNQYRFSRIQISNTHLYLKGSAWKYNLLAFKRLLINIISFGWMVPKSDLMKASYFYENLQAAENQVSFKVENHSLFKIHIITMLLAIPTIGLSRIWYYAKLKQLIFNSLYINNNKITASFTPTGFAAIVIIGAALSLITVGILYPLFKDTLYRYLAGNIFIDDNFNFNTSNNDLAHVGIELLDNLLYPEITFY